MGALTLVLAFLAQDPWKVDFKASVARSGDDWSFRIEGTTDLPSGTILRARILALEESTDPRNGDPVVDEEPLFYGDEAFQDAEVAEGKFSAGVYALKRRPYSLRYRARIVVDPEYQNAEVKAKVGAEPIQRDADFREGDDAKFAEELKATARELHDEFVRVQELYSGLKKEFAEQRKGFDEKRWKRWIDPWMDAVQALRARNDDRMMLWTVWVERQGKMRLEGFCMRLPDLASDCREFLEGKSEVLARTQQKMASFLDYYEEAIEVVGLEMPLDLETIAPALAEYEKQVELLRKRENWSEERPRIKRAAMQALLTVAGAFEKRKKGYYRVNEIMTRFTDLLRLADLAAAPPADFQKALQDHNRLLQDFKTYAGLK